MKCMKNLILASNSPRRKEILNLLGRKFEIKTSKVDEFFSKIFDEEIIKKNSLIKASGVKQKGVRNALIIGADTMVILDSVCLVKPQNVIEALFMLKKLSNKTHMVVTSHTIINSETGENLTELSKSYVTFRKLNLFEIIKYILTKKPLDKAGSYGIQDFISINEINNPSKNSFIKKLGGSYYNVMGLDIDLIQQMLEKLEK